MRNVHLLVKKEDIDDANLNEDKIAVVLDILLATSTITAAMYYGAKEVIPVMNEGEAREELKNHSPKKAVLVGEHHGNAIDGFLVPHPALLKTKVKNKKVILSTTNGTVAIRKAAAAKKVYIASILNGKKVAETLRSQETDEAIVVVCSGASGAFSLEDFYGAGYFLDCLVGNSDDTWELTDSARAALLFFRGTFELGEAVLKSSKVGKMFINYGLEEVVEYVVGRGKMPIVPYLSADNKIIT